MNPVAIRVILALCVFALIGAGSALWQSRGREQALRLSNRVAQQALAASQQTVVRQARAIEDLKRQPFVIYTLALSVTLTCDNPAVLRNWGSPTLDPSNPRIGTVVRLIRRNGPPILLTNPDLSVQQVGPEQPFSNREFTFHYVPIGPNPYLGQTVDTLASVDSIAMRFGPVLRSLNYCVYNAKIANVVLKVNNLTAVITRSLGSFDREVVTFDVARFFAKAHENYSAALAGPR
ncbi:MAG: hypothetical protein WD801_05840 [Gemmatimonadaceae bacterium]